MSEDQPASTAAAYAHSHAGPACARLRQLDAPGNGAERAVARQAITHLRLSPVLFELGARPHPPQDLYRAYLAQSDIFVGLYWERYGWVAPNMEVSGLEDEYLLSGTKPKLIYIKAPAPNREPRLEALLDRIRDDDCAAYQRFSTPEELGELIENDLALLLTERFERAQQAQMAQAQPTPEPPRRPQLPAERSAMVDRERESAELRDLLAKDDVGLVTLTGPGGAGKTRLALHVAAEMEEQFPDGVYFVQLANLTSADQVASALVKAVDARESAGGALAALKISCAISARCFCSTTSSRWWTPRRSWRSCWPHARN